MKAWTSLGVATLGVACALCLSGCKTAADTETTNTETSPQEGAATPEELAERFEKAARAGDWRDIIHCMAPAERPFMALSMLFGAEMLVGMSGDEEARAQLASLREKYQLPTMEELQDPEVDRTDPVAAKAALVATFEHVDVPALFPELMTMFDGEDAPFSGSKGITGLKVEGDTASGMLGGDAVDFRKIDGRWYVTTPEMN